MKDLEQACQTNTSMKYGFSTYKTMNGGDIWAHNLPFNKEQILAENKVNLMGFDKTHGFILENGGSLANHAKQSGGLYFFKNNNRYYHFSSDTLWPSVV
ncbi:hypothetical protein EJP82_25105 [Paenibacillus anaericanus]|uniref:Uncharacterized protein n=1 Tax=Paenibacillus anaericanus TaxID=170367 RepID=A0A3S1C1V1_9BACL|nr:hypothetical protein [Paenibacillus anaericanus]RUT40365.1 hypothetical protein EJP82_25105 [Paenibacillus anaericanus]